MSLERIRGAVLAIVGELLAPVRYLGTYEYRVVTVDVGGLSLQPTNAGAGFPDLARVPAMPGAGGSTTTPQLGSIVLVIFVDGDPSRPRVVNFDDTTPPVAALDGAAVRLGAALAPVVRVGDTVAITGVVGAAGVIAVTTGLGAPPLPSRVLA